MQLSTELKFELDCFFSKLFNSQIDKAEDLAIALDKLSDLAWQQAEANNEDETPPSMRMD